MDAQHADNARRLQEVGSRWVRINMVDLQVELAYNNAQIESLEMLDWTPLVGEAIAYYRGRASIIEAIINGEAF